MPDWLDGFDDLVIHYDALLTRSSLERLTSSATRSAARIAAGARGVPPGPAR